MIVKEDSMKRKYHLFVILAALLLLSACGGNGQNEGFSASSPATAPTTAASAAESLEPPAPPPEALAAEKYAQYDMVTLLPRDAIPAIDDPQFLTADEAGEFYAPEEMVIGVDFNGDARAYSVPFLSTHEIVNDTVGGEKIAVTW